MSLDPDPRMAPFLAALAAELQATPYQPKRIIGQGGMGALVEVEHKNLHRGFAMKLLREVGRPDLEDRLRVEAHALAKLSHPNVLAVVDFDRTSKGRPYIVTELLQGSTLRELLQARGHFSVAEAVDLARQTLAGLSAAHRIGVVHRDIKLENLFVADMGDGRKTLKVIDFGIAKIIEASPGLGLVVAPPLVPTDEGTMMGTPSFMSPEQVTNRPVDHRADLYGVGVVLYRLLTGAHPFVCETAIDYARAHATATPTPPSAHIALPTKLEAIVLRALAKEPGERFGSAGEMSEALGALFGDDAPSTASSSKTAGPQSHAQVTGIATRVGGALEIDESTRPMRRADVIEEATPMTRAPEFGPVAPPSRIGEAIPIQLSESKRDEAEVSSNGTLIVAKNPMQSSIDKARVPTRSAPIDSGPTKISRRPHPSPAPRDMGSLLATAVIVLIVLGTAGYAAWLIHGGF